MQSLGRALAPALLVALVGAAEVRAGEWQRLEEGLELGAFKAAKRAARGDSLVHVLRVDPARFDLVLVNRSAPDEVAAKSARRWAQDQGLVAAINASMFQADHRTSVSLMKTRTHTNNARLSKDNAVLAFDPLVPDVPRVQIIDRTCQDFEALRPRYGSLVQSIRMVSCEGRNVWAQQERRWSTAAVGMDKAGRVLLIHCRSLYSTHDLIEILLALPIGLASAMYVEGGPQAQLYVGAGGKSVELVGGFEGVLDDADDNTRGWPIPNVIGVKRRGRP